MTTLELLAQFIHTFTYVDLKTETIKKAKYCIADTIAVIVKGSQHTNTKKVAASLLKIDNKGNSKEFVQNTFTDPMSATFLNVYAAHAHDYDDTCYAGMTHPSAMLIPVIFALGQEKNINGQKAIAALIIGWEVTGRLGLALPKLPSYGWLTGSHFASLGVAAACAHILDYSYEKTLHTLALSLSSIGGMRESNGTSAKAYTFAIATKNALFASLMADSGITSSAQMLDGTKGYFEIVGRGEQDLSIFESIGEPFIIDEPGACVKKYPVCSSAHAAMQAAEESHEMISSFGEITSIVCETTETVLQFLTINTPQNNLQAQFSLPYLASTCLAYGQFDAKKHLTNETLSDKLVTILMSKFSYLVSKSINEQESPEASRLIITMKDGSQIIKLINEAKGFPKNPFSEKEYYNKFATCLEGKFNSKEIDEYFNRIMNLESSPSLNIL